MPLPENTLAATKVASKHRIMVQLLAISSIGTSVGSSLVPTTADGESKDKVADEVTDGEAELLVLP